MVHLTITMHRNWPTVHVIDHSSPEFNRLTIQQMGYDLLHFVIERMTWTSLS